MNAFPCTSIALAFCLIQLLFLLRVYLKRQWLDSVGRKEGFVSDRWAVKFLAIYSIIIAYTFFFAGVVTLMYGSINSSLGLWSTVDIILGMTIPRLFLFFVTAPICKRFLDYSVSEPLRS